MIQITVESSRDPLDLPRHHDLGARLLRHVDALLDRDETRDENGDVSALLFRKQSATLERDRGEGL